MGIGEFANRCGLSISAVRFYGDRGLLVPASVDQVNRYRRFSPDQLPAAELIRDLRSIGVSLGGIGEALKMTSIERAAFVESHVARLAHDAASARRLALSIVAADEGSLHPVPTLISPKTLGESINQVLHSAGSDPLAPQLMTVLIELKDNSLRLVATDSYRISVRDCVPARPSSELEIVVSAAAMKQWCEILAKVAADTVSLSADSGGLVLDDGLVFAASLPITFPPYAEILNRESESSTQLICKRSDLAQALSDFDGEEPVQLVVLSEGIEISRGSTLRQAAGQVTGRGRSVWMNPSFAGDAVAHAVGEEIVLEAGNPDEPLVFRSADSGTYTSMLMPVLV